MGWLEEFLGQQGAGQNALLTAAQTGGAQALPGEMAQAGQAQAVMPNPLQQLLQNAMRYQQRTGGADPLAKRGAKAFAAPDSKGLDALGQVSTHGAHAGEAHATYDLPDGRRAHVYYDDRGKRQVMVFTPSGS